MGETSMSEIKHTPGPWEIDWYICTADASDVKHAEKNGKEMAIGDELWRVPVSIGPMTADHNHWAGWHLNADEDDARLIAAAPDLLDALTGIGVLPEGYCFCRPNQRDATRPDHDHTGECRAARAAIAKAEGKP
jgi:hypothetical protein